MSHSLIARGIRTRTLPFGLAFVGLVFGLLIARVPLLYLAAVAAGLSLVAASFVEPLVGLGVALVLGPLRAWLEIRSPGVAPHVGQAVLALALAAWVARGVWLRDFVVRVPPLSGPLLAFLFVALLSLWDPVDVWTGFLEWVKWVQIVLVAFLVHDRIARTGKRGVALSIAGLAAGAVAQAFVGIWQFGLRGSGVDQFAISERFYRAYGTFQQPNPYAGFLGLVGALLVGMAMATVVDQWRAGERFGIITRSAWVAAPAALVAAGLGASWSRGGWMGFGAALLVMIVLLPRHGRWGGILVIAALALTAGLYSAGRLPASVVHRLTGFLAYTRFEDVRGIGVTDASFAVMERMAHWQAALGMWRSRFWLGVGLGCYEPAYPAFRLINWALPLGHAHNAYLNLLAEVGLVGLVAYAVWGGSLIIASIVALRRLSGWERALALGLVGAWTHLAAHSLVDYLLVNNVHLHVGVLVALTAYVSGRSKAVRGPDPTSALG